MNIRKELTGTALTLFLCVVAALTALLLVPTSPALLVDEPLALAEANAWLVDVPDAEEQFIQITAYGAYIAAGAALAVLLTAVLRRVQGGTLAEGSGLAVTGGLLALLGAHWLYCLVRWPYIINDLCGTNMFPLQFWQGGYTMYGALLGAVLGGVLAALMMGVKIPLALDTMIPGMLIVLAAGRMAEAFTLQGMANIRAAEALSMLPFATVDEWGGMELAVYPYEALTAFAALLICALLMLLRNPAGRAAETGLAIVSAYQLLFESLRGDEQIKFGFVCLNMILAAAVLVFIIVTRIVRRVRRRGWNAWQIVRVVLLLAGAGIVIAVEFALDGKIKLPGVSDTMLYAADFLAATAMMLSVVIGDGRVKEAQ